MTGHGSFVKTLPPHIRSNDTITKRCWMKIAALIPVLVAMAVMGRLEFLRILILGSMCVVGLEWLGAGFFRKKAGLSNGETLLTGILFALLLPGKCPVALIVSGAFLVAVVINGCFGGLGSRLFNAALFGRVFLDLGFPGAMAEPMLFLSAGDPWIFGAIISSALFFLAQKQIYFETPLYFIAIAITAAVFLDQGRTLLAVAGVSIFSACFLLTDISTLPLTRRGTNLFSIGAAFFSILLGLQGHAAAAIGYAILLMNCFTPWIDVWLKTKPARVTA